MIECHWVPAAARSIVRPVMHSVGRHLRRYAVTHLAVGSMLVCTVIPGALVALLPPTVAEPVASELGGLGGLAEIASAAASPVAGQVQGNLARADLASMREDATAVALGDHTPMPVTAIPEPSTMAVLGVAALTLALVHRSNRASFGRRNKECR